MIILPSYFLSLPFLLFQAVRGRLDAAFRGEWARGLYRLVAPLKLLGEGGELPLAVPATIKPGPMEADIISAGAGDGGAGTAALILEGCQGWEIKVCLQRH